MKGATASVMWVFFQGSMRQHTSQHLERRHAHKQPRALALGVASITIRSVLALGVASVTIKVSIGSWGRQRYDKGQYWLLGSPALRQRSVAAVTLTTPQRNEPGLLPLRTAFHQGCCPARASILVSPRSTAILGAAPPQCPVNTCIICLVI